MQVKNILLKPNRKLTYEDKIIDEIKTLNEEINFAYADFQNQTDSDLLEASIYRLQELRARHSFLMKQAKAHSIDAGKYIFGVYEEV